ncbi:helix-turn-helix domain-containing protein [Anaerocolumna jejuensis]|uniref:helix-turn-helix domain-containing protein n=1 Tax=Anaerocolumna jejuensis TaxID=259063 RepID=UPI000B29D5E8|nr:helix-turn-helix domain-containing protein [Anaerocolumna jejuensis]
MILKAICKSFTELIFLIAQSAGISPGIVEKMRYGKGHIDTRTIQNVCEYLDCQPGDIIGDIKEKP